MNEEINKTIPKRNSIMPTILRAEWFLVIFFIKIAVLWGENIMNAPSIINNNEIIVQSIASCIFDDRIWNLKRYLDKKISQF